MLWWFLLLMAGAFTYEVYRVWCTWRIRRQWHAWSQELEPFFRGQQWDRAHLRLHEWRTTHPHDAFLSYAEGFLAYQEHQIEVAEEKLRDSLRAGWYAPTQYVLAHLLFYEWGRKEEASHLLHQLLDRGQDLERAANTLGVILMMDGKLQEARVIVDRGLRHAPSPELYNTLALIYTREQQPIEAIQALQQGTALETNHVELLMNLGNLYAMRLDYPQAEAVFNRLETLEPKNPLIAYWRGCVLGAQRRFAEAESELHRAIGLQPSFAMAYYQLARILEQEGKRDQAQHAFDTAVQLDPKLQSQE